MCIQKGDLETGFAESGHVLEGEIRTGGQVINCSFKAYNNVTDVEKNMFLPRIGFQEMSVQDIVHFYGVIYEKQMSTEGIYQRLYDIVSA